MYVYQDSIKTINCSFLSWLLQTVTFYTKTTFKHFLLKKRNIVSVPWLVSEVNLGNIQ